VILYFIDRAFDRPMQFFGKLGLVFWGLAFLTLGWALVLKFGYGVTLIQTPLPLLAATIGLSGVLFILLGIIAEVLTRIYFETRGKPPYKVERVSQHSAVARPTMVARKW
jgi:dolichol-phosphate mannosyltransferase